MKNITKGVVSLLSIFVLCSCSLDNFINKSSKTSTPASSQVDPSSSSKTSSTSDSSQSSSTDTGEYSKINPNYEMSNYAVATALPYTPAKGNINLLAIPLVVTDYKSNATETVRQDIEKALFGTKSQTGWESLTSFYNTSSDGQLNITGTVSKWYNPGLSVSTMEANYKSKQATYVSELLEDAVSWYKKEYNTDMTEFDNDNDGYIDGVFFVYSAPDYATESKLSDLFWAFTYWDFEAESNLKSPNPCTYFWCSYDFIYDEYENSVDSHTFCHETGHMLGLDDYYSYDGDCAPAGEITMMDYNVTDLDCYSKFALGWTTPYLVDKEGTLTISLDESVVIPAKGSSVKNAFDEYVMLEIFGPNGLNEQDLTKGYSSQGVSANKVTKDGIRAYHVDSRLCYLTSSDNYTEAKGYTTDPTEYTKYSQRLYVLAHSNTKSYNYLNKSYRLLQLISNNGTNYGSTTACMSDKDLFHAGDKFDNSTSKFTKQFSKTTKLNTGYVLAYDFEVVSISNGKATLKFTAN